MKQMGRGFVKVGAEKPDPEDVRMVEEAWAEAEQAIQSGDVGLGHPRRDQLCHQLRHARSRESRRESLNTNPTWFMLS